MIKFTLYNNANFLLCSNEFTELLLGRLTYFESILIKIYPTLMNIREFGVRLERGNGLKERVFQHSILPTIGPKFCQFNNRQYVI